MSFGSLRRLATACAIYDSQLEIIMDTEYAFTKNLITTGRSR